MNTHDLQTAGHTFSGLGIAPKLLSILDLLHFKHPTAIQLQAIPPAIEGKDVVGIAQTGTGKTLAFGIPMLERLVIFGGRGLILLPTRELALQVEEELFKLGKSFHIRTAVLIGGASMGMQIAALRRDPHIIIATPGRLNDHLEQKRVQLDRVNILVLDEADRMLDMGFWPQVKRILAAMPHERQTMLFSATLSREIMDLAKKHMKLPVRIEVAPSGTTSERVSQEFFIVRKDDKPRLLEKVLGEYTGSIIVFTRTKHGATKVMRIVRHMGHSAADIHGDRSLSQRRAAIDGFKIGKYRVLVATDIAARGIDVKGIELVVNYDLPMQAEDYVHRIGRTARAGADGHAISFAMPDERREMFGIERLIRKTLPVSPLPVLPPARTINHDTAERPAVGGYRTVRRDGQDRTAHRGTRRPFRSHGGGFGGRSRKSGGTFSPR